jgi:hypothetical protein
MLTGSKPVSHAQLGVDVVTAMEAVEMSLMSGGAPVALTGAPEAAVA